MWVSTTGSTSTSRAARSSSSSGDLAFDQEAAAGPDRPRAGETRLDGLESQPVAEPIRVAGGGFDLDVPEHGG